MSEFRTLIDVESLHERLDAPQIVVVDCRFALTDTGAGRRDYESGHIPGAFYADLDRDLAAPPDKDSGRHPLPDPPAFRATLQRWGVTADTTVVAYDAGPGGVAARLWWMLRWLGHRNTAVLDGGFRAWQAAGKPVETAVPEARDGEVFGQPDVGMTISSEEIADRLASRDGFILVDARESRRFRGEIEPIDPVAGHVPGALNLPFTLALTEDGFWRPADELRSLWASTMPKEEARNWGVMCGSGVTACHLVLSAELAGLPEPRLYVGSWSEWVRDPGRPIETDVS
jgi:thiosulfate/3-mercaptopyruvate sulfurtransferase